MIAPFAPHRPRSWVKKKRVCSKALDKMNCGSMTVLLQMTVSWDDMSFQDTLAMKLVLKSTVTWVSWYIPTKSTLRYLN